MDGYRATQTIRRLSDPRKAGITIVAMTANAFDEDKRNAYRVGMNGHIAKPIQMETLKHTLGCVLSKRDEGREVYQSWREYFNEYDAFKGFQAQYNQHGSACGCLVYEARKGERILFADEALIHIFGCSSYMEFSKYVGGSFRTMVHPDDLQQVEEKIAKQIHDSEDSLDRVGYRIVRKDGAVRMVEDIGRNVFTENGSSVFYVCIVDVTDCMKGNEG